MSSLVFPCSICKKPTRKEESHRINDAKGRVMGRTCQACRNTTIHLRCSASKCSTPLYKLKHLKSLSKSADGLPPEAKKTFLENEFGSVALISSLGCCGACYVRLHRLSSSINKSVPQPLSANNSTQQKLYVIFCLVTCQQNGGRGALNLNSKSLFEDLWYFISQDIYTVLHCSFMENNISGENQIESQSKKTYTQ